MFKTVVESIFSSPALYLSITFASLLLWPLFRILRTYFLLRHIPGPFWAHFTGLWVALRLRRGDSLVKICSELDQKYGPVVRLGPKNVLFSDPSVIPIIYATTRPWRKAVSYEPAFVVLNGKPMVSLLTTREEERVTALKRHINYTFTAKAVSDFEHQVDATIRLLNSRVGASMPTVDLNRWIRLYAFETICQIAFSDGDFSEIDLKEILIGIWERFEHWNRWFTLPGWEKLIYRSQLWREGGGPSKLVQKAVAIIKDREGSGGISQQGDLLDRYLQANQKIPEELGTSVVSLVLSTINAGAETTGATMVNTLYFLLSNPSAYTALLHELDAANLESPPTFKSVSQLPYLEATIKETMRLNSVTAFPLEREVPAGGAQIAGYHIPAGIAVAVNERALARSEVWGEEPEAFRPERWLDAENAQRMKMERAWVGFGQGKRMCIGRHIAWMEMKKALPELLLNYNFELLHPGKSIQYHMAIVKSPDNLWVKVVPRPRPNLEHDT